MPTFIIERQIPGASRLTDDELRGITQKSNDAVEDLDKPYTWRHSYVAGDKIYSGVPLAYSREYRTASASSSSPRSSSTGPSVPSAQVTNTGHS